MPAYAPKRRRLRRVRLHQTQIHRVGKDKLWRIVVELGSVGPTADIGIGYHEAEPALGQADVVVVVVAVITVECFGEIAIVVANMEAQLQPFGDFKAVVG